MGQELITKFFAGGRLRGRLRGGFPSSGSAFAIGPFPGSRARNAVYRSRLFALKMKVSVFGSYVVCQEGYFWFWPFARP